MKPTLYLYRSCSSCRSAVSVLERHGVDYEQREFFREPFSRDELENVLERAGMTPSELVAKRSTVWRSEKLGEQDLDDEELLRRMLGEPRLIRRPILVTDDGVMVGFNRDTLENLASALADAQPA